MKRTISRLLTLSTVFLLATVICFAGETREERSSDVRLFSPTSQAIVLDRMVAGDGWLSVWTSIEFPGTTLVQATGINNRDYIVGRYEDQTGGHGFLLRDGFVTSINVPGMPDTSINDINNRGVMVGTFLDLFQDPHGFVLDGQTVTELPFRGEPLGINDKGQIVGAFFGMPARGFLFDDGEVIEIRFPDAVETWAQEINRDGTIVGTYKDTTGDLHGFVLEDGVYTTLDYADADPFSWLQGINSRGQILGMYDVLGRGQAGFVLSRGDFTTFVFPNTADGGTTIPMDINDRGKVVGWYQDLNLEIHGFLLE